MVRLGAPELIIILAIVILLFGSGRLSKIAGELESGIREFRNGLKGKGIESKGDVIKERSDNSEE